MKEEADSSILHSALK